MKKIISLLYLIIFISFHSKSQNLVPNPSFELLDDELNCVEGDFATMMNSWVNPSCIIYRGDAWPDPWIYSSKTDNIYCHQQYYYINAIKPHSGYNYIVNQILVRLNDTIFIQEYIQVKLNEKLTKGQTYYAEYYIALLKDNNEVTSFDNIGMYFTDSALINPNPRVNTYFEGNPQVKPAKKIEKYTWTRVSDTFVAESDFQYLTIGYFGLFDESSVETSALYIKRLSTSDHLFPHMAAYLLDDILVADLSAYQESRKKTLLDLKIEVGKRVSLENIYFKSGESILLPESNDELNKLVLLMKKYTEMQIRIEGYTDHVGNDLENIKLLKERAKAVYTYLLSKGISQTRLSFEGYGEEKPIDSNANESGRSRNRRVEFVIVKK